MNLDIDVEVLKENSSKSIIWRCSKDSRHIWSEQIRRRCLQEYGCPFCSGHRTIKDESIAILRPELAKEWDQEKNGALDPYSISKSSNKLVHWKCGEGHQWTQEVINRFRSASGCKICRKINNSLQKKFPEIAANWDDDRNRELSPLLVSAYSTEKIYWICPIDSNHRWHARVVTRTRKGSGCPVCRKRGTNSNSSAKLPVLSEYSQRLSSEWHESKNEGITPQEITAGSNLVVWWRCSVNREHEWKGSVVGRARKNRSCPACKHPENSLAKKRPDLVVLWDADKNTDLSPSEVTCGSARTIWWKCPQNELHSWTARPADITKIKRGNVCPECRAEANSLEYNYPQISTEWHPTKNAPLTPREVSKANDRKVWWVCSNNPDHEWEAEIKNRTLLSSGCPFCARDWNDSRARQNILDSAYLNTHSFKLFISNINSLKKILQLEKTLDSNLRQPFLRMLYGSAITSLETYLSDLFFKLVVADSKNVENLLLKSKDLKEKKYSPYELICWKNKPEEMVADYVFNEVLWHNLAKVIQLFSSVLGISIDISISDIYRSIAIRHDLIHRNGKDKSGKAHKLTAEVVELMFNDLIAFVKHIDSQTKGTQQKNSSDE